MELRRIVINKEIITQKLSSNKNLTTKRIVRLTNMRNIFSAKKLQNVRIHQKKALSITDKALIRLTKTKIKSTNSKLKSVIINIKVIFKAKKLDRYKDQSNKEEH